jgi:acylglycerol lipase
VAQGYDRDPLVFRGRAPVRTAAELVASAERVAPRLESVRLPLLVLHGEADAVASPDGARMVYERACSADKTLTIHPGLYHEIFNEPEKDVVISDVVTWLLARL